MRDAQGEFLFGATPSEQGAIQHVRAGPGIELPTLDAQLRGPNLGLVAPQPVGTVGDPIIGLQRRRRLVGHLQHHGAREVERPIVRQRLQHRLRRAGLPVESHGLKRRWAADGRATFADRPAPAAIRRPASWRPRQSRSRWRPAGSRARIRSRWSHSAWRSASGPASSRRPASTDATARKPIACGVSISAGSSEAATSMTDCASTSMPSASIASATRSRGSDLARAGALPAARMRRSSSCASCAAVPFGMSKSRDMAPAIGALGFCLSASCMIGLLACGSGGKREPVPFRTQPHVVGDRRHHDPLKGRQKIEFSLLPRVRNRLARQCLRTHQKAPASLWVDHGDNTGRRSHGKPDAAGDRSAFDQPGHDAGDVARRRSRHDQPATRATRHAERPRCA